MAWYIVRNPERAGLVPTGTPWPFAGGALVETAPVLAQTLSGAEAPPLLEEP
jgi:hypothetical protein